MNLVRPAMLACAAILAPLAPAQSTWHVDVNATPPGVGTPASPYANVQYAIDRPTTQGGDTLLLAPGTYVENLLIGDLDLTLRGAQGAARTTIRAAGPGDVLRVAPTGTSVVHLEGLCLEGGRGPGDDGVHVLPQALVTMRDCVAARNAGAGLHSDYDLWVEQCTVVDNGVGVLSTGVGVVQMDDSIIWDNDECIVLNPAFHVFRYTAAPCAESIFQGLDADPLFHDPAHGDYALRPGSPCIDTGDPAVQDTDGSRVDMGAFDFDASHVRDLERYCVGAPNSSGSGAVIGAVGTTSVSAADLALFVRGAPPQQLGLFFHGGASAAQPFQDGTLCVDGPVVRMSPAVGTGTFGSATRPVDPDEPAAAGMVPGATRYVQFWYRDPGGPLGTGSNLSDGLVVRVRP